MIEITSVFENTTMYEVYNSNNVLTGYRVYPNEGYVLHTAGYDEHIYDEETGEETGEIIPGYVDSFIVLNRMYNFETNPLEIYAVLKSEVPADRIFGVDNDYEVM